MKKKILFILMFNLFILNGYTQITDGGKPKSFSENINIEIPVITMPEFDLEKLMKEDEKNFQIKDIPFRFAKAFDVSIDILSSGIWDTLVSGEKICRIALYSDGAYSLNFTFDNFYLPPKAKLFLYNQDTTKIVGALTSKNNNDYNMLSVAPISGEYIVLEYYEPVNKESTPKLHINKVGHDYKNVFGNSDKRKSLKTAGSCNINVMCEEGEEWQSEINSICKIIVRNDELCSGVLINNIELDARPIVLTVNHCIPRDYDAMNSVFMFNYNSPTCLGESDNGNSQSISGSQLLSTNQYIDFTLVELNTSIPDEYNPYFAGWSVESVSPKKSVCLHHPDGDIMKIAIDDDAAVTGNYGDGYDYNTHWRINRWDKGTTEEGSSGSPLFDQNHRVVGVLTGGEADCEIPINDYFTKLSEAWNNYNLSSEQLKYWLDPNNTGITHIEGYDPSVPLYNTDVQIVKIENPIGDYCGNQIISPSIKIRNKGWKPLNNLMINYKIDDGETISKSWNGNLLKNNVDLVTFPSIELTEGKHAFKAFLSSPNGSIDEDPVNDSLSVLYNLKKANSVAFHLKTDNYGNETLWELKDIIGNIVYSGGPYAKYIEQEITETFCLDDGEYVFSITDSQKDGICCEDGDGNYSLVDLRVNEILGDGGNFLAYETVEFSIESPNSIKYNDNNFLVFPNPTENKITISLKYINEVNIELWSLFGVKLIDEKNKAKSFDLDLNKFSRGVYMLVLVFEDEIFTQLVVKI